jgi:hypothetical protein
LAESLPGGSSFSGIYFVFFANAIASSRFKSKLYLDNNIIISFTDAELKQ